MKRTIKMAVFAFTFMAFCGVLLTGCPKDDPDPTTTTTTNDDSNFNPSTSDITITESNVLLQGYTWSSNYNYRYGDSINLNVASGGSGKDWYDVITYNSNLIKDAFAYVWFPPPSDSDSANGYMPRKLNVLDSYYGSESELKSAISAITDSNTYALADIVINHRVGTSNWGTFTDPDWGTVSGQKYYCICSDDEGFSYSSSDMYNVSARGNADTGDGYSSARDLDHTNWDLQENIVSWMTDYLIAAGFKGWRYDYVKGYEGKYLGWYNAKTSAVFSVGEYWPTDSFSSSSPSTWSSLMCNWVDSTSESIKATSDDYSSMDDDTINGRDKAGSASKVFDFVLKGMFNAVFGSSTGSSDGDYSLLASEYMVFRKKPGYAVTFVDNHDCGSTQALWTIDSDDVGVCYAYILTHPGYPCVAWQHYFTADESFDTTVSSDASQYMGGDTVPGTSYTYREFIRALIALRMEMGITETSSISVTSSSTQYIAYVTGTNGTLEVVIGDGLSSTPSDYTARCKGTKFQIYSK